MSHTYHGGCHCGAVEFTVDMDLQEVLSCNCSICSKKGQLLAFAPADHFKFIKGESNLSDYQFGKKTIHHLFCKTCGIASFGKGAMPDGTPMVAVNVRCLDDVDIFALKINHYDGKNI